MDQKVVTENNSNISNEPIPIGLSDINLKRKKIKLTSIIALILATILLSTLAFYYIYSIPAGSVIVDANTSINLKYNRWSKVVDVSSIDNDGNSIIAASSLKNKNIDDALIIIINKAEAYDYLKSDKSKEQTVTVYISGKAIKLPLFYAEANTKNYTIRVNDNGIEKYNSYKNKR